MIDLNHGEVINVAPITTLKHENAFIHSSKLRLFETSTGISGVFELEDPWFAGVGVPLVPGSAFCAVGADGVLVVDDSQDLQAMSVEDYEAMKSMCPEKVILMPTVERIMPGMLGSELIEIHPVYGHTTKGI